MASAFSSWRRKAGCRAASAAWMPAAFRRSSKCWKSARRSRSRPRASRPSDRRRRSRIEIEAAGLAAIRSSPAQQELIFECLETIKRQIAAGAATVESDRAFHLAIADATNNPRFRELLEAIGKQMIPRSLLQEGDVDISPAEYLTQIQNEHAHIARAITDGDDSAARDAMRMHLKGSQQRYRSLIRRA